MSMRWKSGQNTEKSVLNIWKVNLDKYIFGGCILTFLLTSAG